ncbi:MAG: metal-binding protein [Lachnospiraceae bacterium]|nr:metal-binding protein [Lachnospiraceae bacterium]
MEHSSRFFENRACQYFPCHQGMEECNCLFCYCPLYARVDCPGNPSYLEIGEKRIKVCSNCTFPHRPENYDAVIEMLKK